MQLIKDKLQPPTGDEPDLSHYTEVMQPGVGYRGLFTASDYAKYEDMLRFNKDKELFKDA